MFADKLLRKNKKIRQACKVEGKILQHFRYHYIFEKSSAEMTFTGELLKPFPASLVTI